MKETKVKQAEVNGKNNYASLCLCPSVSVFVCLLSSVWCFLCGCGCGVVWVRGGGGGGEEGVVCVVWCGLVQASLCAKAFMETLFLDPSTTALPIIWRTLLAITISSNTNREIMAYRVCCLLA